VPGKARDATGLTREDCGACTGPSANTALLQSVQAAVSKLAPSFPVIMLTVSSKCVNL
jgi:hypothetical protein